MALAIPADPIEDILTYRDLWQRVIQQAIRDAMEFDRSAIVWLLAQPDDDFIEVCSRAERDPRPIREGISVWLLSHAFMSSRNLIAKPAANAAGIAWQEPSPAGRMFALRFMKSELWQLALETAGELYVESEARDFVRRATLAKTSG